MIAEAQGEIEELNTVFKESEAIQEGEKGWYENNLVVRSLVCVGTDF